MLVRLVEKENTVHRVRDHLPRLLLRLPNDARHESGSGAVMLFELCRLHYTEQTGRPPGRGRRDSGSRGIEPRVNPGDADVSHHTRQSTVVTLSRATRTSRDTNFRAAASRPYGYLSAWGLGRGQRA